MTDVGLGPTGWPGDTQMLTVTDAAVVLVRHGRTVLNADGLLRGHLDPELDEAGQGEVAALAESVAALLVPRQPVKVVTSPLRRAVQTAQAIAACSPAPIEFARGLIDRDYGQWAGHSPESVVARFGSLDAGEGVEAAGAVATRARAVLNEQLPLMAAGPVVLVAHDVVNRLLLAALDPALGPWDGIGQRTACWNLLIYRDEAWKVSRVDQK